MAIACHYDLTKLKFGSKLTKIIDTIYRKQWQEETSQVSQDKGLGRNCQGHPPTDFISHCFSLGTWFFIGSHNIRPGVEPIHVGRLIFVHHDETPKALVEKLPRPPTPVFVNYCFSLRIQSFFTGSHKIQPGVEPIWMINICPWWWNSGYTFLESDSEISISESQFPASANLRAVHTGLKKVYIPGVGLGDEHLGVTNSC